MQSSARDKRGFCLSLQFGMRLEDESWLPIVVLKSGLISGLKYKISWGGVACLDVLILV